MSEQVDDVTISCDKYLTLECEHINETLQWIFQVETEVRAWTHRKCHQCVAVAELLFYFGAHVNRACFQMDICCCDFLYLLSFSLLKVSFEVYCLFDSFEELCFIWRDFLHFERVKLADNQCNEKKPALCEDCSWLTHK